MIETDFDQNIKVSLQMLPPLTLLLLVLTCSVSPRDPFVTLVAYENNQRMSAEVGDSQYHLLPFRVSGKPQHFIQAPQANYCLNVEVLVHWISNVSRLYFPEFDLTQKVRLVIEEESVGATLKKSVLTKEFLTQTGFKLQLEAGRRYRWKIESSGLKTKLIEIAIINKPTNISSAVETKQVHQEQVEVLREMSRTLAIAKRARVVRQSRLKEKEVADMWAWMSGVEMVSLLGFLLVQLTLFEKFILNGRSVV